MEFIFHVFLSYLSCIFIIFIVVTAFLDEDGYTVSEVDGALEVCVVLDGFIDREVTVNLSTVNGTAIGIICISFIWFYKETFCL